MLNIKKSVIPALLILLTAGIPLTAQDNIGLPYLKIGVGPRQAGMGNVFTGVGDDVYTMQWNPGGMGHIRRWQWSAAYNKWFADIYQASILGAKQFRFIGTRKATVGFFCSYLGMPEWDSTGGMADAVTANHLTAGLSFGQRLDWIHESIAIGATVKTIRSQLADYTSETVAVDGGLLIKPNRFDIRSTIGMGLFDYGILTLGVTALNMGSSMSFDQISTELPMTMRYGAGWKMGRYNGWSVLLAMDLDKVDGRAYIPNFGGEIWWKEILGARFGYRVNDRDLGDFTFGFGLRWDDVMSEMLGLPTRYGDAFEVNLAGVDYGDVLEQTYRGSLSHYSVAPEPFNLQDPEVVVSQVLGISSLVEMQWETTIDPDPYDEVSYLLLVDRNKKRMDLAVEQVQYDMDAFLASSLKDSLMLVEYTDDTAYNTTVNQGGIYYWAVVAYDLAHHVRLAKRGEQHVGEFIVATADLLVKDFSFTPSSWITTTPEQGVIQITLGNQGNAPSGPFQFQALVQPPGVMGRVDTLCCQMIRGLSAGEDTLMMLNWKSDYHGMHRFNLHVDPDSMVKEIYRDNNIKQLTEVSIPKGILFCPPVVEVMATGYDSTEIPIVPEVYFDSLSSVVLPVYYDDRERRWPVLETFAERLDQHPDVTLNILGSVDRMSSETDLSLALRRAENVKMTLTDLGISESRLKIIEDHPEKVMGTKPLSPDPQNNIWRRQQNRVVQFQVPQEYELALFGPHKVAVDTTLKDSVYFDIHIHSPAAVQEHFIQGSPYDVLVSQDGLVNHLDIEGQFLWDGTNFKKMLVPRNQWYTYQYMLVDSLNRSFKTYPDSVYLREKRTIRRREVFGAAKFAQTEPVYQFYWDKLMEIAEELVQNPDMRVRFEGHACVIGSEAINRKLSRRRATRFTEAFKERILTHYPDQYRSVVQRIDMPVGYGESEPLTVRLRNNGEVLLGDNETPDGRYMNRRIMVLLYKEN